MNSAVESIAYGYDQLDRLTLACAWNVSTTSCVSGQFNQSFRYDKLGNILTKAGTSYTYDSIKPHAVTVATALITRLDFVHELTETVYVTQFDETSFTSKLTHRDFKPLLNPNLNTQIPDLKLEPKAAFEIANREMAQFQALHGEEWAQMMALEGQDSPLTSADHPLIWHGIYGSLEKDAAFDVLIDAQTGEVLLVEQRPDDWHTMP